jgi:hypothetical protein
VVSWKQNDLVFPMIVRHLVRNGKGLALAQLLKSKQWKNLLLKSKRPKRFLTGLAPLLPLQNPRMRTSGSWSTTMMYLCVLFLISLLRLLANRLLFHQKM